MNIDLESLTPGAKQISEDEVVRFEDVNGNESKIDCHVELTVRKINDAIYVHADLTGEMLTFCHNCLEPAKCDVESSFDVVYRETRLAIEAAEGNQATGDEELIYVSPSENQVSLDEQIHENLMAGIPIRIVCKDDCKGLCSHCGANLNLEKCACTDDVDSRWEALQKLKDDIPEK
jgi:uncharacterized protein